MHCTQTYANPIDLSQLIFTSTLFDIDRLSNVSVSSWNYKVMDM